MKMKDQNELPITDERMTRFMISLEEAVDMVWKAFNNMNGGEIFVRKIPSIKVIDIAKAIAPKAKIKLIGIRPGEKLHEQMISIDENLYTYEYKNYYKIFPSIYNNKINSNLVKKGKKVRSDFEYRSDKNEKWIDQNFIKDWIKNYKI